MLAMLAFLEGMGWVQIAILIVVIAAVCALVYIGLKAMGIALPPWFVQCLWIVVIAVVVILAIKFVAGIL